MDKDYVTELHREVQEKLKKTRLVFGNENHIQLGVLMERINKQISLVEKRYTKKNQEDLQNLLKSAKYYLDR